jgi:glycosyltransferase involved in cell wall biosynthesis
MECNNIGVSVCIFSFNYEKYLSEAIESVIEQVCDFNIEIIISDDCSADNTKNIAQYYYEKYPDLIVLSINSINEGGTRNWVKAINLCRGKYIALLDGDDYFTDKQKLQIQYDVLEKDDKRVLCFHSVEEKYDDNNGIDKIVEFEKNEYSIEDIFRFGWFIRTSSTFFRNGLIPTEPPSWIYDFPYRYDTIIHVFLCQHGNAVNVKKAMSVWRKHDLGMSKKLMENQIINLNQEISLIKKLNSHLNYKHNKSAQMYQSELNTYLFLSVIKNRKVFSCFHILTKAMLNMKMKLFLKSFFEKLRAA